VIAHVVLFRERAGVALEDRRALARALDQAHRQIPAVRRFHVGRRVRHGRPYEQAMTQDYTYAAVIEFDDVDGLKAYLNHPAHEGLARLWASLSESTLVYDYEMRDASDAGVILGVEADL
jgi:hypothetical protein